MATARGRCRADRAPRPRARDRRVAADARDRASRRFTRHARAEHRARRLGLGQPLVDGAVAAHLARREIAQADADSRSAACFATVPPRPISMSSGCGPNTSRSTGSMPPSLFPIGQDTARSRRAAAGDSRLPNAGMSASGFDRFRIHDPASQRRRRRAWCRCASAPGRPCRRRRRCCGSRRSSAPTRRRRVSICGG